MRRKLSLIAILIAFMALSSASRTTALNWMPCEQAQLEGTWDIYVAVSGDDCLGELSVKCVQVQINANGTILSTGAILVSDCGEQVVIGGQLTLTPTCIIEGYIQTTNGTIDVERGGDNGDGTLVVDAVLE